METLVLSTLQSFLAAATQKAATDLAGAFSQLPENKRLWVPAGTARTATDLVAECVILSGYNASLIRTRFWSAQDFQSCDQDKLEVSAQGWDALHTRLLDNSRDVADVISALPDTALAEEIEMPGGSQTVGQIMTHPYWNMTYHWGQINHIASLLGLPD
jgi:uncharacterized damage-inducible protein DinB